MARSVPSLQRQLGGFFTNEHPPNLIQIRPRKFVGLPLYVVLQPIILALFESMHTIAKPTVECAATVSKNDGCRFRRPGSSDLPLTSGQRWEHILSLWLRSLFSFYWPELSPGRKRRGDRGWASARGESLLRRTRADNSGRGGRQFPHQRN